MKYRYSWNEAGRLIDINSVSASDRNAHGPYFCFNCKTELLPVLGDKRVHHFRHRSEPERPCALETYLHNAAKLAVAQGFSDAVAAGHPYILTRARLRRCMHATAFFPEGCVQKPAQEDFDLTRWLDKAEVERSVGGFVADVLLSGEDGNQLLVEIEVTHACEPKKIASGLPIVELTISTEEDIAALIRGMEIDTGQGRGFNLSPLSERQTDQCRSCLVSESVFIVYRSGKIHMPQESRQALLGKLTQRTVAYWTRLDPDMPNYRAVERMETALEDAYFDHGAPAKSCLLCTRGAINWKMEQSPMVCFREQGRPKPISVNDAAGCASYAPVGSREELHAMRRRQAARRKPRDPYVYPPSDPDILED